jgi:prenyl protein peptidase
MARCVCSQPGYSVPAHLFPSAQERTSCLLPPPHTHCFTLLHSPRASTVPHTTTTLQAPSLARLAQALGLRLSGLPAALTLPLALNAILFAGPLATLALDVRAGRLTLQAKLPPNPLMALRNLLAAPLTEEFTFRSCLIAFLLLHGVDAAKAATFSPLIFGAAHLHHAIDLVVHQGVPLLPAALSTIFQTVYTTAFGWFAALLLLRTGHLLPLVLVHAFCNFMGMPQFQDVPRHPHAPAVISAYVAGIAGFALLLRPLTRPQLYGYGTESYGQALGAGMV